MLHREVGNVLESIAGLQRRQVFDCNSALPWQQTDKGQMIFKEEIGAEYGGPYGSVALSTVYNNAVDGRLTIIGDANFSKQSVWGRLTLVKITIGNEEDYYTYLQKLLLVPLMHSMEGIMIRLQPSEYKEWIRMHRDYVKSNTIINLFQRLHRWYKEIEGVQACESVVICSNKEDLDVLLPIIEKHREIMKTFAKRLSEHIKACDTCDNSKLCKEINSSIGSI